MLFSSVVFTTFLVVVFSVAFFATDLSPVTAGFAVGFTVVEAAGFVAVVALPVVADFAAVTLVLDFAVLVDFVALTGLAGVTRLCRCSRLCYTNRFCTRFSHRRCNS